MKSEHPRFNGVYGTYRYTGHRQRLIAFHAMNMNMISSVVRLKMDVGRFIGH